MDTNLLLDPDTDISNNQGIVYYSADSNGETYVWKISQGYDFSIDHEARVMEALTPLKSCCPNYVYSRGKTVVNRKDIPADVYGTSEPISVPMTALKMDYISNENDEPACSLNDLSTQPDGLGIKRSFSIFMQLTNALWFGQRHCGFTHYDLHMDNVLIKPAPLQGQGALYISDTQACFTPLYDSIPVIFDYGHSYVNTHDHQPIYTTFEHAPIGYLPCVSHPWVDARILCYISQEVYKKYSRIRRTNRWVRWLGMFKRRGFSNYQSNGWETDVNLGVPVELGAWLVSESNDDIELEMAGDALGALSKFPFTNRREPESEAQKLVFQTLVQTIRDSVCYDIDSDFIGVVYAVVHAFINRQNLIPVLQKLKTEIGDNRATLLITTKRVKKIAQLLKELAGYVEHFHWNVWQARAQAWEEKSGYISKGYRSMESIAREAVKAAPEGIGEDIKEIRQVTVYDLVRKRTTVIDVPEFAESPAEITLMYRRGEITKQIQALYSAE